MLDRNGAIPPGALQAEGSAPGPRSDTSLPGTGERSRQRAMTPRSLRWPAVWLAIRSLVWTVLLPGLFAGYFPWRFFGLRQVQLSLQNPVHIFGLLCIGLGGVLLVTCIWEFARTGRGTLAPVDPPRELVVRGLYRYVRNPMYLSVTMIVLGEFLLTWSRPLLGYWAVWFVGVNLFVIGYEEPTLRRRFGVAYDRYREEVGRWLPRFHSRHLPPPRG